MGELPIEVGYKVELLENARVEEEGGVTGDVVFEDRVEQYVPKTGLLRFEESEIGLAEFINLREETDLMELTVEQ
jgi:hypothetical protein